MRLVRSTFCELLSLHLSGAQHSIVTGDSSVTAVSLASVIQAAAFQTGMSSAPTQTLEGRAVAGGLGGAWSQHCPYLEKPLGGSVLPALPTLLADGHQDGGAPRGDFTGFLQGRMG